MPSIPTVGSRGGWSLSQRSSGDRRRTPWTGRQSITGHHLNVWWYLIEESSERTQDIGTKCRLDKHVGAALWSGVMYPKKETEYTERLGFSITSFFLISLGKSGVWMKVLTTTVSRDKSKQLWIEKRLWHCTRRAFIKGPPFGQAVYNHNNAAKWYCWDLFQSNLMKDKENWQLIKI